jgi:hypothetical protein
MPDTGAAMLDGGCVILLVGVAGLFGLADQLALSGLVAEQVVAGGVGVGELVGGHGLGSLSTYLTASKGDPEASGRTYALPYARQVILCAPCAWLRWRSVVRAWEGADGGPGAGLGSCATPGPPSQTATSAETSRSPAG